MDIDARQPPTWDDPEASKAMIGRYFAGERHRIDVTYRRKRLAVLARIAIYLVALAMCCYPLYQAVRS